eukprot:scaffold1797_cov144-Pinguiococcus_pyrenoidosus.AAC.1
MGRVEFVRLDGSGARAQSGASLQRIRSRLHATNEGTTILQTHLLSDLVKAKLIPKSKACGSFRCAVEGLRIDKTL